MFGMWSKLPSVGEDSDMGTNKTWRVSVDAGFKYLVRLHLCEAGLHMDFVLLINGRVALTSADMLQQRRGNTDLLWYNNYMLMEEGLKQGDITISLHSRHEFLDRHGPLEGFEVFKMSSHQNASLLIQTQDSPLQSQLHSVIYNTCLMIFIVYFSKHKMSQYKCTKEDNIPAPNAKQLNHQFSLAGICKHGGVSKGFVDCGRETVGIKPLQIDSKQRESKFQTVIEQQEMILVNKYIPSGTLADDKQARKTNDFFPQSWEQRNQICIGVSRALEHLHTGPMVIHRDLKPGNILLCTKLALTFEYTSLDIITTRDLTKQSDIYSFGALMLKVLCGRAAMETRSEKKCSLTTLAERTKVEDAGYDKSQQENMNLIVPNEKIDFDNHVSGISLSDVWLHSICYRDDFHLGEGSLRKVYKSLYNDKSSVSAQVKPGVLMDSLTGSQKCQMTPGFRFHPTDEELMMYCLWKKLKLVNAPLDIDLHNYEPWDLPKRPFFGEQEWFFSSPRDRKRATSGQQKATGMHHPVLPKGIPEWVMMLEYMLEDETSCPHMIEYPPSTLPLQKLTSKSHWK